MKKINLTGRRFERWTVLREDEPKCSHSRWLCKCDCGNIRIVQSGDLRSGKSKSCGCLHKEKITIHGMSCTTEYHTWKYMIQRCTNPKRSGYKDYGGRGITVCPEWLIFENFFSDMGLKPKGLTLERIDNNKGYYPENCKWATPTEQMRNRRVLKTNKTGFNGITTVKETLKYMASITADCKTYNLGTFPILADAIEARKHGEQKYWNKENAEELLK